ncbi:hypothetical protein AC579_4608, partial [Pseudocercospora musae]
PEEEEIGEQAQLGESKPRLIPMPSAVQKLKEERKIEEAQGEIVTPAKPKGRTPLGQSEEEEEADEQAQLGEQSAEEKKIEEV